MEGTFLVNSFLAKIFLDSGASHFFISHSFMRRLHLSPKVLDIPLSVETPLGDFSFLKIVCRNYVVSLDDVQFKVDLIVFLMSEFDNFLGMNWLSSYHISIDYFAKIVSLRLPGRVELVVVTSRGNSLVEDFLAQIEEVFSQDQGYSLIEMRVVFEFQDIF